MKLSIKIFVTTLLLGVSSAYCQDRDKADVEEFCEELGESVAVKVLNDKSAVLTIVSTSISENESCAGEVVSAAIKSSNASNELVGQIVEVAATVAPSQISVIARSAFIAAPKARANISAAVSKVSDGAFDASVFFPAEVVSDSSDVLDLPSDVNSSISNGDISGSANQGVGVDTPAFITSPNP